MSPLRRSFAALLFAVSLFAAGACTEDENSPTSPQSGDDMQTPTSGNVPPGNPQSGETGTDGSDTGSR